MIESFNWTWIVFIALVILITIYACAAGKVVEWLKYAVAIAEKDLGSGTGQLKLRQVYDMFIDKFPAFSSICPFFIFSNLVDIALKWFKDQLMNNPKITKVINEE